MGSNPTSTASNKCQHGARAGVACRGEESQVLGPQGTLLFLLLVIVFAGLMVWMIVTRQVVLRVLAAFLAFIPAMVFGIATVNKYYDYYQNWG